MLTLLVMFAIRLWPPHKDSQHSREQRAMIIQCPFPKDVVESGPLTVILRCCFQQEAKKSTGGYECRDGTWEIQYVAPRLRCSSEFAGDTYLK